MKLIISFIILAQVLSDTFQDQNIQSTPSHWNDCSGTKGYIIYAEINPVPLIASSEASFKIAAKVWEKFTINQFNFGLYVYGDKVAEHQVQTEMKCDYGYCELQSTIQIPSNAPNGNFDIMLRISNDQESNLLCLNFSTLIKKSYDLQSLNSRSLYSEIQSYPSSWFSCQGTKGVVYSTDINIREVSSGFELSIRIESKVYQNFTISLIEVDVYDENGNIIAYNFDMDQYCSSFLCTLSKQVTIPQDIPSNQFSLVIRAQNDQDFNLLCLNYSTTIKCITEQERHANAYMDNDKKNVPDQWTSCGGSQGIVSWPIINPYPIETGSDLDIQFGAKTWLNFTISRLEVSVSNKCQEDLGFWSFSYEKYCKKGFCSVEKTFHIPNEVPSGFYDFTLRAQNEEDNNLLCLNFKSQVRHQDQTSRLMKNLLVEDCGGKVVKISSMDINPTPVQIGKQVTLQVQGISISGFSLEKLSLTVYKNEMPVLQYDFKAMVQCVEACPVQLTNIMSVPNLIQSGHYIVELQGFNSQDQNLLCARTVIDLVKPRLQQQQTVTTKPCKVPGKKGIMQQLEFSQYPLKLDGSFGFLMHIATLEEFTINNIKLTAYVQNLPIIATSFAIQTSCGKQMCLVQDNVYLDSQKIPSGKIDMEIMLQNEEEANLVCARTVIEIKKE